MLLCLTRPLRASHMLWREAHKLTDAEVAQIAHPKTDKRHAAHAYLINGTRGTRRRHRDLADAAEVIGALDGSATSSREAG
jgi:hypothetical protein